MFTSTKQSLVLNDALHSAAVYAAFVEVVAELQMIASQKAREGGWHREEMVVRGQLVTGRPGREGGAD